VRDPPLHSPCRARSDLGACLDMNVRVRFSLVVAHQTIICSDLHALLPHVQYDGSVAGDINRLSGPWVRTARASGDT